MSAERVAALTPFPLEALLGRAAREWERDHAVFDLPARRWHRPPAGIDLGLELAGGRVATPAGLAAGPHTQLAQNIVLGWLGGARAFELKTVQRLDRLEIPRPCIDMGGYGLNVEWSQELTLDASLEEYAKAAVMLAVLGDWAPLRQALGEPGPHLFELSVGYDLEGISSPPMRSFIDGLRDARPLVQELQRRLPPPFTAWRDRPLPGRLIAGATLSTFHGCPPGEIAAIARHLMSAHELDVTIKLNPTLLGEARARDILHGRLGHAALRPPPEAFAEDLALADAVALIRELASFAAERGRVFGVKLTNTLVVANDGGRLPGDRCYLSGPALHPLAAALQEELTARLPDLLQTGEPGRGAVPVAFSAGVGRSNFADVVGTGAAPVTVCSDLLQPGGYGRLAPMLAALAASMRAAGCADLPAWRRTRHAAAIGAGHRDATAAHAAQLATPEGARPYTQAAVARPPRKLDIPLARWDCSACNLCVVVCPNDAMLALAESAGDGPGAGAARRYVCLAELCNACGNCTTFCPENGQPFAVKPRLFLSRARWEAEQGPAFLVRAAGAGAPAELALAARLAAPGETRRLGSLINGPRGLPLRAADLPNELTGGL